MKKFSFIVSAGFVCLLMSCGGKGGGMSAAAKKNLEASQAVTKAFDTGDTSKINDVIAADFVDHTDRGDKNRDSLKAMIVAWKAASKDSKTEVIKELADDDYVFSWLRFTGTSDGSMGMPAGPYDMSSIEVVKFKDGKAIEHWGFMEMREMMKMMANMPQPPADTAKKNQ